MKGQAGQTSVFTTIVMVITSEVLARTRSQSLPMDRISYLSCSSPSPFLTMPSPPPYPTPPTTPHPLVSWDVEKIFSEPCVVCVCLYCVCVFVHGAVLVCGVLVCTRTCSCT
eukprot:TRINITY_DN4660_c0_g1_i10.p2 TRINITY_DN4660_c0_g1~~TRINITY_DN4660_c0_g1_i10.p2  ORF type:complete len:112 (-),score=12.49 TRINITY_DN4660_c0_g1_i10:174-509(-)